MEVDYGESLYDLFWNSSSAGSTEIAGTLFIISLTLGFTLGHYS